VVVAGMALGTLFTLLVIPAIYVLLAKQHVGEQAGAIGSEFASHDADILDSAPEAEAMTK